jgi:hypothetical protein
VADGATKEAWKRGGRLKGGLIEGLLDYVVKKSWEGIES